MLVRLLVPVRGPIARRPQAWAEEHHASIPIPIRLAVSRLANPRTWEALLVDIHSSASVPITKGRVTRTAG